MFARTKESEYSIPEYFEQIVCQFPDHLAVKTGGQTLTYRELDRASNRIAHRILALVGRGTTPVGLFLEDGVIPIIALLGIVKAGKFYVTLTPSDPAVRLKEILGNTQIQIILTDSQNVSLLSQITHPGCHILNLDTIEDNVPHESVSLTISPDSLMALFYTSGSTGLPKGIGRTHRHMLHAVRSNLLNYHISDQDHIACLFSYSFGASAMDIFYALLSGATLYPYNNFRVIPFSDVTVWIKQEKITFWHSSVSLFRQFLDRLPRAEHVASLRIVVLTGQTLYKQDVERFRQHFSPTCVLVNQLGSTEAGTYAQFFITHQTKIIHDVIPVGYACEGKELFLMDETGQQVGFNSEGEIAVKSYYLAPGYWQNPELTQQKFLPDPNGGDQRIYLTGDLGRMQPDGCLEHLGRKDFQVKIRGYRVELTEIEAALYRLETIKEVVVVARDDHTGEKSLIAYVVPCRQPAPTPRELRRALAATLPDYMIPSVFVILDALPLTPHGKVDRHALPAPEHIHREEEGSFVVPETPTEILLAEIWQEVLGVERVGVYDKFFDLGGHSLLVMQMIAKVEKRLQVRLHPRDLMFQTLGQVASVCEEKMSPSQDSASSSFSQKIWSVIKNTVLRTIYVGIILSITTFSLTHPIP